MRDYLEELIALFKHSPLPIPQPVEEYDRALAAEMGISFQDTSNMVDSESL